MIGDDGARRLFRRRQVERRQVFRDVEGKA